uniref:Uncharacterized protein n=1 Tax=Rhizophora mucronata TaxID=61149 RepID=A0A2P2PFF4_RHIMU
MDMFHTELIYFQLVLQSHLGILAFTLHLLYFLLVADILLIASMLFICSNYSWDQ